jgi:hypothetical protein
LEKSAIDYAKMNYDFNRGYEQGMREGYIKAMDDVSQGKHSQPNIQYIVVSESKYKELQDSINGGKVGLQDLNW